MKAVPDAYNMNTAHFGQVFSRPQYDERLRVMCIAPDQGRRGTWVGYEVVQAEKDAKAARDRLVDDFVSDGWLLCDD